MQYSAEQIKRFSNKDKRIIVQSTLKAILGDGGIAERTPANCDSLLETAFYITDKIIDRYPTDEVVSFSEATAGAEPFPSKKKNEAGNCPDCGAEMLLSKKNNWYCSKKCWMQNK